MKNLFQKTACCKEVFLKIFLLFFCTCCFVAGRTNFCVLEILSFLRTVGLYTYRGSKVIIILFIASACTTIFLELVYNLLLYILRLVLAYGLYKYMRYIG